MGNSESKNSLSESVQFGPCGTDPYTYLSFDEADLPRGLKFSMKFLTRDQFEFCQKLCDMGQDHLFDDWEDLEAHERTALVDQLKSVDHEMKPAGGIKRYISTAQKLLDNSNYNPNRKSMPVMNTVLRGWTPSVPAESEVYQMGSSEYARLEKVGLAELGRVGICIAALRMSDNLIPGSQTTKPHILLPVEITTETTYLQFYIEYIRHIGETYNKNENSKDLPLCIMTNAETDLPIRQYLEENEYFGMDPTSITIFRRRFGVPALMDSDARIELDPVDPTLVLLQDRGHGDFHALLFEHETAREWLEQRQLKWLYMMEHETNGLAFQSLPLMLGVSKTRGLIMNSMAVPRKAKDSVLGAICALKNKKSGLYKNVSVESYELDALLQSKGYQNGEVNDKNTGFSRFQGNTNQLVFDLDAYVSIMDERRGQIPKVISPVYDDEHDEEDDDKSAYDKNRPHAASNNNKENQANNQNGKNKKKTTTAKSKDGEQQQPVHHFQEPMPMQSRMQDFVHLLTSPQELERVGFTNVSTAQLSFSPIIHSIADSADPILSKERKALDLPAYTASSAEADQYGAARMVLETVGCTVETPKPTVHAGDVTVVPGPAIVFKPNFGHHVAEIKSKILNPDRVRISPRSTLVIRGEDVMVESLDLDGCLLVDCDKGKSVTIDRAVVNGGWEQIKDPYAVDEMYRMRGYLLHRKANEIEEAGEGGGGGSCVVM